MKKIFYTITALVLTLLLLAACSNAPWQSIPPASQSTASSTPASMPAPASSSQPVNAPATSVPQTSVPSAPPADDSSRLQATGVWPFEQDTIDRAYENYELTRTPPPQPYAPSAELPDERSNWIHFLDPMIMEGVDYAVPQPVVGLRFYNDNNTVWVFGGVFETDAIVNSVRGDFTFEGEGVFRTTVGEVEEYEGNDGPMTRVIEPMFTLDIKVQFPAESPNLAVITFSCPTAEDAAVYNDVFSSEFGVPLDTPLTYINFGY